MPAYYLEALTITLGLILLLAEAFVAGKSKAWVGIAAALGLAVMLGLTCIALGPNAKSEAAWAQWPLWNFYEFDSLAMFYKGRSAEQVGELALGVEINPTCTGRLFIDISQIDIKIPWDFEVPGHALFQPDR